METNVIHPSFKHGDNFKIGHHCVIEEDCVVGNNVDMQNFVLLKKGTIIGDNCYIDSYFRSSGGNSIGNNVTLRFGSTIARAVYVEDDVFIAPNVMTVYSLPNGTKSSGTYIKKGAFIATAAVLAPNITIGENVVIGTNSFVNCDCEPGYLYVGNPAIKKKFIK